MDTSQRRTLHGALADFYSPGLNLETVVERGFALTSKLLRFSLNSHGLIDAKTGVLTAHFDSAPAGIAEAFSAFGRHMKKYPAFRFDPSVYAGKPYSVRDFYGRASFQDLDIHQEVYKPMGYVDHAFMHIPTGTGSVVFVGFLRDGRPFDAREKAMMGLLQPHLSNGQHLARAVTTAQGTPLTPELFSPLGFTPRECDVLHHLVEGHSNGDIAVHLRMRPDSVSRHLRTIYAKLGVEHRVTAAVRALEFARQQHAAHRAREGSGVILDVMPRSA